jgi:uncharacterized protein (DUF1697 family)
MPALIAMLRGVNLGGNNLIRMDSLRSICESLKLEDVSTYINSGNVVFTTKERKLEKVTSQIEDCIEKQYAFRPAVILRTVAEMQDVIARNPFAKRKDLNPSKLIVVFFSQELASEVKKQLEAIKVGPEELKAHARELYIYYPDGMGKSKLPAAMDRVLKKTGTARNWNTVTKLLGMVESLDSRR